MSQPPYQPGDTQPGYWSPPSYQPTAPSYPQPYGAQPGGWQDQQYGYPGYGPYGQPPQRGNGMAVAGFVLSFFFGLLGLIFSIIGLRRSSEPGRNGRGLAIAGIVISALNLAFWLLVGIGAALGSTTSDGSADSTLDATGSSPSSSTVAPVPGSETVVDACHVIVPAVTGAQADIQTATSVSDMLDKVNRLADTVEQHGAATGDAAFTQDTAHLAQEYRDLLHAAQTGTKPDYTGLAKAGEQVGFDCGKVGVLPN